MAESNENATPQCVCPQCGAPLMDIKQKRICRNCGIVEGCCEGGQQ